VEVKRVERLGPRVELRLERLQWTEVLRPRELLLERSLQLAWPLTFVFPQHLGL